MRGVDRRKIGFKLSHRELDRGRATTLAGDDGLRMRCGRDLLQLSISAHDPMQTTDRLAIPNQLGKEWALRACSEPGIANNCIHGRTPCRDFRCGLDRLPSSPAVLFLCSRGLLPDGHVLTRGAVMRACFARSSRRRARCGQRDGQITFLGRVFSERRMLPRWPASARRPCP